MLAHLFFEPHHTTLRALPARLTHSLRTCFLCTSLSNAIGILLYAGLTARSLPKFAPMRSCSFLSHEHRCSRVVEEGKLIARSPNYKSAPVQAGTRLVRDERNVGGFEISRRLRLRYSRVPRGRGSAVCCQTFISRPEDFRSLPPPSPAPPFFAPIPPLRTPRCCCLVKPWGK